MKKLIASVGVLTLASSAFGAPVVNSCQDLEALGAGAFNGAPVVLGVPRGQWSNDDTMAIAKLASRCLTGPNSQFLPPQARSNIGRSYTIAYQYARQDSAAHAREANLQKQANEDERRHAAEALQQCDATPAARLYNVEERIIAGRGNLANYRSALAQEHRIAQTSGVRDLRRERNEGEAIVELQDDMKVDFEDYKQLGGKARSPDRVAHAGADPCAAFRPTAQQ